LSAAKPISPAKRVTSVDGFGVPLKPHPYKARSNVIYEHDVIYEDSVIYEDNVIYGNTPNPHP
jgi:hypothetical protein